jgi:predicted Zn-dependent protease
MTETEARNLLERALQHSQADHLELLLQSTDEASTRFANNQITQNVAKSNTTLTVRSAFDNRVGVVKVNHFAGERLADAVRRSEEIARVAAPDTEYVPPPDPAEYPLVEEWDDAVAHAEPAHRASMVHSAIQEAEAAGVNSAGSCSTRASFIAVANSKGLFAAHRATMARFAVTAMTDHASGWASAAHWKLACVDAPSAADRAIAKALLAGTPGPVEAEPSTVILEPAAVAEILAYLLWSLDAKAADEGRSAFSGRLGQKVAAESVTLASDATHPECPTTPFFEDGSPVPPTQWIHKGVLTNLATSRFWAQKTGRPFTGRPVNLIFPGEGTSLEEMIASTKRGLLVTRFWYIRSVDPMRLLLTGMTRDGLFRIENGEVVGGARNLRFNESPIAMLERTVQIGASTLQADMGMAFVPPIKVEDFNFTSATRF